MPSHISSNRIASSLRDPSTKRRILGATSILFGIALIVAYDSVWNTKQGSENIRLQHNGATSQPKQKKSNQIRDIGLGSNNSTTNGIIDSRSGSGSRGIPRHEGLDFIIAGFSKCGTSTLMGTLAHHEEVDMPEHEYCWMTKRNKEDDEVMEHLHNWLTQQYKTPTATTKDGHPYKRGLKCPTAMRHVIALERLERLNPQTRVVVGLRHPVLFFQSFYNYRVQNNAKIKDEKIPDPYDLIGDRSKEWQTVYTDLARFEDSFQQLGKVELNAADLKQLAAQDLTVTPSNLLVFIYEIGQLADTNTERAQRFRSDLQEFLGLQKPLEEFGHRNAHKKETYPETLNICDEEYDALRQIILGHATRSKHWIRDHFIKSDEVFVGGRRDHFVELIDTWDKDPCVEPDSKNR